MDNNCANNYRTNSCRYCAGSSPRQMEGARVMGKPEMCERMDGLVLAMGYVPWQYYQHTFELSKGLQMGTIFPELCKPFCGKRGGCKC